MTDHTIGASDVAGILGLSPWQTPAQTWARLTGLTGHPLFALGDSITWVGMLRDNVAIRFTFRVVNFSENSLQLGGTAELLVNK